MILKNMAMGPNGEVDDKVKDVGHVSYCELRNAIYHTKSCFSNDSEKPHPQDWVYCWLYHATRTQLQYSTQRWPMTNFDLD